MIRRDGRGDGQHEPRRDDDVVVLDHVSVRYETRAGWLRRSGEPIVALDDVSVHVRRGRSLGIVGATGSGKSTLAQVVMGMVEPASGSVRVEGRETGRPSSAGRTGVQIVMQDPHSSLDGRLSIRDIIAEPLTLGGGARALDRAAIDARVAELLALVGLPANRASRYPHQFSGGQRQRIAIARALAPDPAIIVLDEPTSALDVSVKAQILNLLRGLQSTLGVTYLVISHDLVTVAYLASQVVVMHLGRIVEQGPRQALFDTPRHPYTLELLSSAPGATGAFLTRPRPSEESPASLPPTACQYAYRCALRTSLGNPSRCIEERPELADRGDGHAARCHFADEVSRLAADIADPFREPADRTMVYGDPGSSRART